MAKIIGRLSIKFGRDCHTLLIIVQRKLTVLNSKGRIGLLAAARRRVRDHNEPLPSCADADDPRGKDRAGLRAVRRIQRRRRCLLDDLFLFLTPPINIDKDTSEYKRRKQGKNF